MQSKKTTKKSAKKKKRQYTQAPMVHDVGLKCPHCGECYNHKKAHKYKNGRQRMICSSCGKPFVKWK